MIFLSDAAIEYAVKICAETSEYQVGIFISKKFNPARFENIKRNVIEIAHDFVELKDAYYIKKIVDSDRECSIRFSNDSQLFLFDANWAGFCGFRLHLLIADMNINERILTDSLLPMEYLDWQDYKRFHALDTIPKEDE